MRSNQEAPKSASEWLGNTISELKKMENQDETVFMTAAGLVGVLEIIQELVDREDKRNG